jgi:hypothetical protein
VSGSAGLRPASLERGALVTLGGAGRAHRVAGVGAELVALVVVGGLSPRTLRLLWALALEERRLASIDYGAVTADLAPTYVRLALHQTRPRIGVDQEAP